MSFQKRLKMLVDEKAGGNISEFARGCEVEESSVRQWLKGPSKPTLDKIVKIARAYAVSLDWLVLDVEASDSVNIPKLGFSASAGAGHLVQSDQPELRAVPRDLLRKIGVSERNAKALDSTGDSMQPTIMDGDPLIVDSGVDAVIDGRIYAFTIGDEVYVKRLRRGAGHLIMMSDNPDWPTREEPIPASEPFAIIGRVRWIGRTV